jgi:hypothetical protein
MTFGFAASSFALTVSNGSVGRFRYVADGGSGSADPNAVAYEEVPET